MKSKIKTAAFLGFVGEALTVTEARVAAEAAAIAFVADSRKHAPTYLRVGPMQAIVWRDTGCWTYDLVGIDARPRELRAIVSSSMGRAETIASVVKHLFALTVDYTKGDLDGDVIAAREALEDNCVHTLPEVPFEVLWAEMVRGCAFQRAYIRLGDATARESDVHRAALDACTPDALAAIKRYGALVRPDDKVRPKAA